METDKNENEVIVPPKAPITETEAGLNGAENAIAPSEPSPPQEGPVTAAPAPVVEVNPPSLATLPPVEPPVVANPEPVRDWLESSLDCTKGLCQ